MAHTPGPWIYNKPHLYKVMAGKTENHMPVGFVIADLESFSTLHHLSREERQANAKLIAAAPDLLEALKFALSFLEANNDGEEDIVSRINKAKAAISDAT